MNDLERFKAIIHFEKPDFYPIFGMPGAPGFSSGCMEPIRKKLVSEGMPTYVGSKEDGCGQQSDRNLPSYLNNTHLYHQRSV